LAAATAVTATVPPTLPLPRIILTDRPLALPQAAARSVVFAAYRSRAPPQA
jgi:hypothetical protein